jgi:hypothetical protein
MVAIGYGRSVICTLAHALSSMVIYTRIMLAGRRWSLSLCVVVIV